MKKIVVIGLSGESVFLNVDHFNSIGETVNANYKFVEPGGKGFNQAVSLGKMKADVSFITVLGTDDYAKVCEKTLIKNNVKPYIIVKNQQTDYAVIVTDSDGENNVIVYNKASNMVTYNDIMFYKKIIDQADILLLQLEFPYEVMKKVINYAYNQGIKVVLNPAPSFYMDIETLHKVSVLIPNEFEVYNILNEDFCVSTDEKSKNTINRILKRLELIGVEIVICTRGGKSVCTYHDNIKKEYPIKKVERVDSTGAGDIFCSGVVYGLACEMNFDTIIRYAMSAASLSVTKRGVLNSIHTKDEIFDFMEGKYGSDE